MSGASAASVPVATGDMPSGDMASSRSGDDDMNTVAESDEGRCGWLGPNASASGLSDAPGPEPRRGREPTRTGLWLALPPGDGPPRDDAPGDGDSDSGVEPEPEAEAEGGRNGFASALAGRSGRLLLGVNPL